MKIKELKESIFSIENEMEFEKVSLDIFRLQAREIPVYKQFLKYLQVDPENIDKIEKIPFLPIEFFKSHGVFWPQDQEAERIFSSSGTTGMITSKHKVTDLSLYEESFRRGFEFFYGEPSDWVFLALLPNYQEREGSSLIYMVDDLIRQSKHAESGYFLYNHQELYEILLKLKESSKKVLLMGVTYALLDFAENFQIDFPQLVVMETGGMKGKRREMIREEVHFYLKKGFQVEKIHSEYGMTELLSQGYSKGEGLFQTPPWMKILIRDTHDHFSFLPPHKTGGINVIDLANLYSCSFLATQDLGKVHYNPSLSLYEFEVLGRFDQSDIRGCNLMVNL